MQDTRWKQRFANYQKALLALNEAAELAGRRQLAPLEEEGLIKRFEFTYELGWTLLKDYLEALAFTGIVGSRSAIREAFKNGLVADGQLWIDMVEDRIRTAHTYDEEKAREIALKILHTYRPAFLALEKTFAGILAREATDA